MNKSIFTLFPSLAFLVLLFACSRQNSQSLVTPSNIPLASATAIPTQMESRSTAIPTETPIFTPTPYLTKQVVLDYSLSGLPLPFEELIGRRYSILVLYSDGQLIRTGRPFDFQQKFLTVDEKAQFLSQLESLGLSKIESNQQHDPTDTLYHFGSTYKIVELESFRCITTTEPSRDLCAYTPYHAFLVPEMKNILYFLDRYKPGGMTLYSPDRLLLEIENGRTPSIDNVSETPIVWPAHFPSLEITYPGILYIEGEMASEVYAFLANQPTSRLVTQNGLEYTIEVARPVLPHEVMSFP